MDFYARGECSSCKLCNKLSGTDKTLGIMLDFSSRPMAHGG